jgi:hypothetical protein
LTGCKESRGASASKDNRRVENPGNNPPSREDAQTIEVFPKACNCSRYVGYSSFGSLTAACVRLVSGVLQPNHHLSATLLAHADYWRIASRFCHLVIDNLNIHRRKSLTDAFGEQIGREVWKRFTIHFTPAHGSWFTQAEIDTGLFARKCLGHRRITDLETLRSERVAPGTGA